MLSLCLFGQILCEIACVLNLHRMQLNDVMFNRMIIMIIMIIMRLMTSLTITFYFVKKLVSAFLDNRKYVFKVFFQNVIFSFFFLYKSLC